MLKLQKRQSNKAKYAVREYSESGFIPYHCHWSGDTILTKQKELLQIVKIEGFSFETADDEDVDFRKEVRNSLFKSMATGNYALWFHIIRRRQSVTVEGEMPAGFANYLNEQWKKKHESHDGFTNDLYITVIRKADKKGMAILEHAVKSLQQKADKSSWEADIKEAYKELTEATNRVISTLRDYKPRLLSLTETPDGVFSEPLEFLGKLVNCGISSKMIVPTIDISKYLATHRMYFGNRAIEMKVNGKPRFAGIISIKEYATSTHAGMLDSFLQLPFEFIISQSYVFSNRQSAIGNMQTHQRRMIQSQDVAVSQIAEINEALDAAMSGTVGFGEHHLTVMCMEDSLKKLDNVLSLAVAELVNLGINPVREKMNLQGAYWAQLPANFEYIARKAIINTLNLSGFSSLHNYPLGKKDRNHWGPAVTVLDTTSGTPYFFNFHARDVGHTTIIGPTGAGKTVMMNFLCCQAQKYKCRMFFFDKDRGAEIFIRALGGYYTIIETGKNSGFNPLQLEDTSENRGFLVDWMRALVTSIDKNLTPEDIEKIQEAVVGNFKLSKEQRYLTNIAPFLGIEGPGTIANRLKMWWGQESHAKLFDNKEDQLDFSKGRVFGFEMGEILKDKTSLGPVLLYLFQKISLSLDGTPTMIVLDEAWALIDNDVFAPKIKDWLKTLRKLNAMVVFATQSVEDASKSTISDTLIQQTATQLFLANPKATEEYRKTFMLSAREFALIKTIDPATRFFLVKQGSEVVIARIDLSSMPDVIHVLSGRAETVRLLDEAREQVGDDPEKWLPLFIDKVKRNA